VSDLTTFMQDLHHFPEVFDLQRTCELGTEISKEATPAEENINTIFGLSTLIFLFRSPYRPERRTHNANY